MPPATPPPLEVPIDVVGFILASMSVLVVYQLFSIESWMAAVSSAVDSATELSEKATITDFERREVLSLIRRARFGFPLLQAVLLMLALSTLAYINVLAAGQLRVDRVFTVAPTLILCAVVALSTIGAVVYAQIRLSRAARL